MKLQIHTPPIPPSIPPKWRDRCRPEGLFHESRQTFLHFGGTSQTDADYDALAANDSAVLAMDDAKRRLIVAEMITQVKKSVAIDWNLRESACARSKVMVARILNKYGYPPDLQDEAVKTALAQAEPLCADWVLG